VPVGKQDHGRVPVAPSSTLGRLTTRSPTTCHEGPGSFVFHETGVDAIDADFARTEFLGQHAGDCIHRAFAAGVDRQLWPQTAGDVGGDVDHAAAGSGANGRIWPTMMSAELPEGWA
jgi:hypothetical protein